MLLDPNLDHCRLKTLGSDDGVSRSCVDRVQLSVDPTKYNGRRLNEKQLCIALDLIIARPWLGLQLRAAHRRK